MSVILAGLADALAKSSLGGAEAGRAPSAGAAGTGTGPKVAGTAVEEERTEPGWLRAGKKVGTKLGAAAELTAQAAKGETPEGLTGKQQAYSRAVRGLVEGGRGGGGLGDLPSTLTQGTSTPADTGIVELMEERSRLRNQ
jgi:hypothetical protein